MTYFDEASKHDHPTLDVLMYHLDTQGIKNPLDVINKALKSCGLPGRIIQDAVVTETIKELINFKDGKILIVIFLFSILYFFFMTFIQKTSPDGTQSKVYIISLSNYLKGRHFCGNLILRMTKNFFRRNSISRMAKFSNFRGNLISRKAKPL